VTPTPGQQFDLVAFRFIDALRGISGLDIAFVLWPEVLTKISVYVEPITVGSVGRLVLDDPKTASELEPLLSGLDKFDSGVVHTFVLVKTNKANMFVVEAVHDGRVLVEDLFHARVTPFLHGKALPVQELVHGRSTSGGGDSSAPAMALVPSELAAAKDSAQVAGLISGGKAELFATRELSHGPSMAHLQELARTKSSTGYDLLSANCQHLAQDAWKFAVGHSLGMPNQNFLDIFKSLQVFGPPTKGNLAHGPGILNSLQWSLQQASSKELGLNAAALALPHGHAMDAQEDAPRHPLEVLHGELLRF